jgi:MoaA/NifB/PqqE/SkfB family radical SAM enzyme
MFRDSFCSSPWYSIRVLPNGNYNVCRWASSKIINKNISNTSLKDFYNSEEMSKFRLDLLNGEKPDFCKLCYYQDDFGKLSGRKKQLLKSGITDEDFELKTRCSQHYDYFKFSYENNGKSNYFPTDFQIDLGNTCNSACIMCDPKYSSRLAQDYKILSVENSDLFKPYEQKKDWTQDPKLIDKFITELTELSDVKYIHIIGGETLYMKAFYQICDKLVECGLSKKLIVGTTTNGTIYNKKLEYYAENFREFHLAISVEALSPLNDYIRYGGKIESITKNIKKFKKLEKTKKSLFFNLQITPNIFTVSELDTMFEFVLKYNLTLESTDILTNPSVLRMELMPDDIRKEIIVKLEKLIVKHNLSQEQYENIRNKNTRTQIIANNIIEYYEFLKNYKVPDNAEEERFKLVKFLKSFEKLHNNKITDYAPRYKKFLTDYGY